MEFLKKTPAEVGVPPHMMTVDFRAAKGPAATLDVFRAEPGRQGFDHAEAIYAAILKDQPDFKLDEAAVNRWAYDLMAENHLPEATDLLKLNVQLFPGSANACDSLGEAYMKSGQRQRAIDNYTKSLALNPANDHAKEQLKVLGRHLRNDLFATTEKMVEGFEPIGRPSGSNPRRMFFS